MLQEPKQVNMKLAKMLLLLSLISPIVVSLCDAEALRLHATHADAGRGLSKRELLHRMASRSKARSARLLSGRAVGARVGPGVYTDGVPDTEYLVHMAIGTPPQPVQLVLDTGSDLTWTQCWPCMACFRQALPLFDPSRSLTFAMQPCYLPTCRDLPWSSCGEQSWGDRICVYSYSYADKSITTGHLDSDTFTFASADGAAGGVSVPDLTFGCGIFNSGVFMSNETGIAGFARGALSLPSQLKADNFSYCFTAITGSEPSPVFLGVPANLYSNATHGDRGVVQSTALIRYRSVQLKAYYISLKGITVGTRRLPIPESMFALKEDGTGGAIIDSGTGMTMLPEAVYNLLCDAFVAQTRLSVHKPTSSSVSQLCFSVPPGVKPDVPALVLHFEGASLDLPRENYMFEIEEAGGSVTCLAINPGEDLSVIGNFQQQNLHVLYDLANNMLSFIPAQCNKL
ncbi:aspartic proteinase nepenthesin-1-like [Oryza brachyantha]|uniref:aspartic proteinase nepenthesin-1-like n=1 Tax=Oryza brachyantha TaxID=4533 RepID=UPI001ADB0EBC|nr:aspartic proteinase nepenthesin-1-like [Oryza brachyantha]